MALILAVVWKLSSLAHCSREELTTMLTAILQSTSTILHTVAQEDTALMHGEDTEQAVRRMVSAAFDNCDITRTGKLLPLVSYQNQTTMYHSAYDHVLFSIGI